MNIRILLLSLLLIGCSVNNKSFFKRGTYVEEIQSGCVGTIFSIDDLLNEGEVTLTNYVCFIELKDFKYTRELFFETHQDNLKYADGPTVDKYNEALAKFIIKKQQEKQDGEN